MPPQDLATPVTTSLVPAEPAQLDVLTADLPADLDELGRRARWHEGQALLHAYESGRALRRAQNLLPHGAWGPWLEANFPLSERVAQQRMQLVEWIGGRQQLLGLLGDVSVKKVRLLMQAPESDVDELVTQGTIGGLPLEKVKTSSYASLAAEVEKMRRRAETAEALVEEAAAELEAAQAALAERQIGARRRDAVARWNAKIDKVRLGLDDVFAACLEPLLDELAAQWDLLPEASQAHATGLLQYLETRTRLEALVLAQRLGNRPGAAPTERVPLAIVTDVLLADREEKSTFAIPERRIPAGVSAAMEREGISLNQAASPPPSAEAVRDVAVPLPDGRIITVPRGSRFQFQPGGGGLEKWIKLVQSDSVAAVGVYVAVTGATKAAAKAAVKQVSDALAAQQPKPVAANNPIDQDDF